MARTLMLLDAPRPELIERPLDFHRYGRDIAQGIGGKNQVQFWRSSNTYTLAVLNLTNDFTEKRTWEGLKLRLTDFNAQEKVWTEQPEQHDSKGGFDYFLAVSLDDKTVPDGYPHTDVKVGKNLTGTASPTPDLNYQANDAIQLLTSKKAYPYNQGYMLRFYQEGRGSYSRGNVLQFGFGEYILGLNSNGSANLYQTADFQSYTLVFSFTWAADDAIHDTHHTILICPHGRNKIDINVRSDASSFSLNPFEGFRHEVHDKMRGAYTVPGELVYNADDKIFNITAKAPCSLFASREFRPFVQVSLLGYVNGGPNNTPGNAFLYDAPLDLGFPPSAGMGGHADYDPNGGTMAFGLFDPTLGQNWQPGKPSSQQIQFAAEFYGDGNGPGGSSQRTPELYGYSLTKGPQFQESKRKYTLCAPSSYHFTGLGSAEHESVSVTVPNGRGQVDRWTRRGKIPVALGDPDSGLFLFEGTTRKVHSVENIRQGRSITLEVGGMAEDLKKAHWLDNAPNFGRDPNDSAGRGYFWNEAVYRTFELAGFPRSSVVIEDGSLYDFRLWDEVGGGGAGEYKGKETGDSPAPGAHGDQHADKGIANKSACFQPKSDSTPCDFLAFLFEFLHWHWQWNPTDHCWHVYKRPLPTNTRDLQRINTPKAVFIGDTARGRNYAKNNPNIAVYVHTGRTEDNTPPTCAGVTVNTFLSESGLATKAELAAALAQEQAGGGTSGENNFPTELRQVPCTLINPLCFANGLNSNPDALPYGVDDLQFFSMRTFLSSAPSREALAFIARRSYYKHCFGQTYTTLNSIWGDYVTVNLRKWDTVLIDSAKDPDTNAPNGKLEAWQVSTIEPSWARDNNRRADYRFSKLRYDCPAPY